MLGLHLSIVLAVFYEQFVQELEYDYGSSDDIRFVKI